MDDCCAQWANGTSAINSALFLAQNHGCAFAIKPFDFCPWCGAKKLDVDAATGCADDQEWADVSADGLRAALSVCDHEWTDARNEVVQSGEICLKCNTLRAGNVTSPARAGDDLTEER